MFAPVHYRIEFSGCVVKLFQLFDNILYKTMHLHAQNKIYRIRIPKLCVLQINKDV